MFTMDIVVMFPSLPRAKTKEAMKENLEKRKTKKIPTEDLISLRKMI